MKLAYRAINFGAACLIFAAGMSGTAHADSHDIDRHCPSDAYGTSGRNHDHSDDGCDTSRYENRGKFGNSAPESLGYGHAHPRDDTPAQTLIDGL
jgi:hypothetical protein